MLILLMIARAVSIVYHTNLTMECFVPEEGVLLQ